MLAQSLADKPVSHKFHVHLISDSTGDTLNAMATAALAQFENVDVQIHPYALVRSEHQLTRALDHVAIAPGMVFFTLANEVLRDKLIARCDGMLVECVDVLEGPVSALRQFLGTSESHKVGRQHQIDQRYLERIEALEFTIQHDDGQSLATLNDAQVILTGASRTSKTPTCVYLAIRGVKAANVPLVAGMPPPPALLAAKNPLIVGLWISPDRLIQVRRNRLMAMGHAKDSNYVDPDAVRAEIAATRQLFEAQGWPMIDVSRRSIEETSAAVLNFMADRKDKGA
ncbi:MAG: phosphoenolpyruvate synthase regulatory protein [Alphaproteobacteria bacterium 64-11]|nr:MAG: phosphoenolpyruvate synthase regulatory protein [Alphaproteobacteria bacterium 64-11]